MKVLRLIGFYLTWFRIAVELILACIVFIILVSLNKIINTRNMMYKMVKIMITLLTDFCYWVIDYKDIMHGRDDELFTVLTGARINLIRFAKELEN